MDRSSARDIFIIRKSRRVYEKLTGLRQQCAPIKRRVGALSLLRRVKKLVVPVAVGLRLSDRAIVQNAYSHAQPKVA